VYIPKTGTIKKVYIHSTSGTAGSNESWSLYVRVNNTTDYLIQTVGLSATERIWSNSSLSISVTADIDYLEIKSINPTWGTNPANLILGGYVYIE
jgi:hypothetical protein